MRAKRRSVKRKIRKKTVKRKSKRKTKKKKASRKKKAGTKRKAAIKPKLIHAVKMPEFYPPSFDLTDPEEIKDVMETISENYYSQSKFSKRDVTVALKKSNKELYEEIGNSYDDEIGSKTGIHYKRTPDFYPKKGKSIFKSSKRELYEKICVEFNWCKKSKVIQDLDPITYFGLLSPLISAAIPAYVPVVVVFALLVKYGLNKFCQCK